jgi:hypothetical protein
LNNLKGAQRDYIYWWLHPGGFRDDRSDQPVQGSGMMTRNDIAFVCVVGAIAVALSGNDGWGWLLFIGFLAFGG